MVKIKRITIDKDLFNIQEIQKSMSDALSPIGNWNVVTTGNNSLVVSKGIWIGKYNFVQSGNEYTAKLTSGCVRGKPLPVILMLPFVAILFPLSLALVIPFIIKLTSLNKRHGEVISKALVENHNAKIS